MGPGAFGLRRLDRGCTPQAPIRPLLREEPLAGARPARPDRDRQRGRLPRRAMTMTALASVARNLRALFVLACAGAALAGCVSTHPPVPAVTASAEDVYKVGPLDSLNIVVWRNPDLSGTVQVRPDGRISTPLVQDLN